MSKFQYCRRLAFNRAGDVLTIELQGVNNPEEAGTGDVTVQLTDDVTADPRTNSVRATGGSYDIESSDIESSLNADLTVPKAAPYGSEITATATFENNGESDVAAENIVIDGSAWSAGEIDNLSDQTIASGENVTLETTFNTNTLTDEDDTASQTNDIVASIEDQNSLDATSASQGLTVGTSDSGAVEVEVTDTNNNPVNNVNVTLYQGSQGSDNIIATGNTGDDDFLRFDGSSDGIDGGLAVGASGSAEEYVVKAQKEGFEASTRSAHLDTNNVEEKVSPSLQRIITPDDIDVSFEPSQSVGIENEITATVSVTTDDKQAGNGLPIEDTPVAVSYTDDNGADSIDYVAPNGMTTDEKGEVEFTFSVTPGTDFDDIESVVATDDLVFEATDGNDVTTAENSIEFVPDIGDTGTISGTITKVSEDQQLGVQSNLDSPEGVPVYAVDQDDVEDNTETLADGDDLNVTVPAELSDDYSTDFTDVRFSEGDIFRVVTFDENGDAVPRDPRSDYLTTTSANSSNLELVQNESVPGVQIHQTNMDRADDDIEFTFLESGNFTVQQQVTYTNDTEGADDVETQFKNVSTTTAGTTDDLVEIGDTESITYSDIADRFDEERAVPNDTTTATGDFMLLNLPTDQDGTQEYTVIAGQGAAADGEDQFGFANFAGFETDVPVEPNADDTAQQQNVDLSVQEFTPVTDYNYNLDVTVEDGQKFAEAPVDEPVAVEVTATRSEVGSNADPQPATGIDIDLDALNNNIGDFAQTSVTTDAEGVATTTFTGDSPQVGSTNITATFDSGEEVYTTEGNEQATVDIFQDAQITGDVVTDKTPSNNLPDADVTLSVKNETDGLEELATTQAGPGGSFSFTGEDGVRSGLNYTVEATYEDEEGNEGTGFAQLTEIPGGTTNADIVIEDVVAPEGFDIQDGSLQAPANAAPGEEIEVAANITNTAGEEATSSVTFVFDGEEVDSQEVTLGAGETDEVSFDITVPDVEDGEYEHGIETDVDAASATLNVTTDDDDNESSTADDYRVDGEFTDQSVFDAVKDWRSGAIDEFVVFDVIDGFRNN
ncbi:hypothetical protein Natpe_1189 [Natrinema pellirubrum DSM 15624]|uniref:Cell surface glycoprotein n=1 Tax=Natrinema pellirubrum (strain DSM 15624 / CIP 106293 / JCM 10476 / NCIMB 786 / 157) TaxID=797303 RepID=L0JL58_NATP1|nr:hypothetical protein Natpe_1189 [Natrinema pellirubrum DSM 15624]